ncbi:MAG: hypothetical protein AB7S26_37100, partial [Sandaracinaceae bacterium]
MSVRQHALALSVAVALHAGCAREASQLIVQIDSDLPLDVQPPVAGDEVLRAVHVEVCDDSCEDATAPRTSRLWSVTANGSPGRIPFPFSFGVAPFVHDASRRVEVRVSALRRDEVEVADAELFTVRRQVGFTAGR